MNEKQARFCEEFVVDLNATQAYIRAGYSKHGASQGASKLLRIAHVAAKIKELQSEIIENNHISLEGMIKQFVKDRDQAREMGNINASIRANEMIAKMCGLFEADNEQKRPFSELSSDELDQRLNELLKKASIH